MYKYANDKIHPLHSQTYWEGAVQSPDVWILHVYIQSTGENVWGKNSVCMGHKRALFIIVVPPKNIIQQLFTQHSHCIRDYEWCEHDLKCIPGRAEVICRYYTIYMRLELPRFGDPGGQGVVEPNTSVQQGTPVSKQFLGFPSLDKIIWLIF